MENNYDQIIQKEDMYLSMKRDNSQGIGLKRMADIVDETQGIFQTNTDNHIFTVHIMIPQKEDDNETNDFNS
jgi:sensor histidine kinase regulating citrate/malate metabolism